MKLTVDRPSVDTFTYNIPGYTFGKSLREAMIKDSRDTSTGVHFQMWHLQDFLTFANKQGLFAPKSFDMNAMCEVVAIIDDKRISPFVKYVAVGQLELQSRRGALTEDAQATLDELRNRPEVAYSEVAGNIATAFNTNGSTPANEVELNNWASRYIANFR